MKKNDFNLDKERDALMVKEHVENYDNDPKATKNIKVVIILFVVIVFAFILLVGGLVLNGISSGKESVVSNKDSEIISKKLFGKSEDNTFVKDYVKEKYGFDVNVEEQYETFASENNETENKEIMYIVDDGENRFSVLVIEGKEKKIYDNYESDLIDNELEKYFEQKLNTDCNVKIFSGILPEEKENLFSEHIDSDNLLNLIENYDFYAVVEILPETVDILTLKREDFPEIFKDKFVGDRHINKKITFCRLKEVPHIDDTFVEMADTYLITENDETNLDIFYKKYNFIYDEIKVVSNNFYKSYTNDIFSEYKIHYFKDDVKKVELQEEVSIKDLPNYKKDLSEYSQTSGKYIFTTNLAEYQHLYVAIKISDLGLDMNKVSDVDKLFRMDAIEKNEDGCYERVFCVPYGDYILFDFKHIDNVVEFFLVEEK